MGSAKPRYVCRALRMVSPPGAGRSDGYHELLIGTTCLTKIALCPPAWLSQRQRLSEGWECLPEEPGGAGTRNPGGVTPAFQRREVCRVGLCRARLQLGRDCGPAPFASPAQGLGKAPLGLSHPGSAGMGQRCPAYRFKCYSCKRIFSSAVVVFMDISTHDPTFVALNVAVCLYEVLFSIRCFLCFFLSMEGIVGAQLLSAQPLLAGKLRLAGINIVKLRKTLCKPLSWLAHSLVFGHLWAAVAAAVHPCLLLFLTLSLFRAAE